MNEKIVIVIVAVILAIIALIALFKFLVRLFDRVSKKDVTPTSEDREVLNTAERMPLRDISGKTATMKDKTSVTIIEIECHNDDLLSWDELNKKTKKRASALSGATIPFLILSIQRPAETTSELRDLEKKLEEAQRRLNSLSGQVAENTFEKKKLKQAQQRVELLKRSISEAERDAKGGGAKKSHTYICFGVRGPNSERIVQAEAEAMIMRFANAEHKGSLLVNEQIVRLFMDHNGTYPSMAENARLEPVFVALKNYGNEWIYEEDRKYA